MCNELRITVKPINYDLVKKGNDGVTYSLIYSNGFMALTEPCYENQKDVVDE